MCAGGSISNDCDDVTGMCRCNEGVGEDDCSACLDGFFNFTTTGCTGTHYLFYVCVCAKLGTLITYESKWVNHSCLEGL